ncbi:MAG: hypothetical protein NC180_02355 [Muribaculaceae bacterium]|nr:hypothetical protein [Roseburia sp.]MCM1431581.1 hypothetical protein [Muribaculaceae bacterium]MCM1492046.1 hypothetical protein [Muribaculaceae bacterium]
MRIRRKSKLVAAIMAMCLTLTVFTSMPTRVCGAKESKLYIVDSPKKTVSVQLDGVGKKEKIKYTISGQYFDLYIDGENVWRYLNERGDEIEGAVFITDMDISDKSQDIFVVVGDFAKGSDLYYCKYKSGEFQEVQDATELIDACNSGIELDYYDCKEGGVHTYGDKTIYFPIWGEAKGIGQFYGNCELKLKNGKLKSCSKTLSGAVWGIRAGFGKDYFGSSTIKKKTTFYSKAGGKTKAFTAKKGDMLHWQRFCFIKSVLYIQVVDHSIGKEGWIKSSDLGAVIEFPKD